nr:hypothetical protein [Tanacetum cinerariifolium]
MLSLKVKEQARVQHAQSSQNLFLFYPADQFEEFSDSNDDSTLIDDDYFSIDNIDYVEASPPDSDLVSLKE